MTISEETLNAFAGALSGKGIPLERQHLLAIDALAENPEALGLEIERDIEIEVRSGRGQFKGEYLSLFANVGGTLTILKPAVADEWHLTARDNYNERTIYDGRARFNESIRFTYRCGFRLNLEVNVVNLTQRGFTGKLLARVKIVL